MSSKPAIGFCGLGAMGFGMATHLVKSGYPVSGFDVYAPTLEKFNAARGTPAMTLTESAKNKNFYVCMVATAQQAESALFSNEDGKKEGVVYHLPQGAVLLLCSTVPSAYAKDVERKLGEVKRGDIHFIDCPVSGGAIRAADGTLSIMAGGSPNALEKGKWLLEELSAPKKLFIVEGGVGAGSNMKMVHQVLAAIQILAVSEAFGFAARLGLDAKDVRKKVLGSEGWSWMFENRSVRTLTEDYFPGASALTIILKDVGIITSMSRLLNFPTPLCTIAEQVYLSGVDRGWGPNDDAGMVRLWTSEPVSNITPTLSPEEISAKLNIVVSLLSGIHLCAAAESIAFAKHVGLPLPQLYELAVEAAGGSALFKEAGAEMISLLDEGKEGKGIAVFGERLKEAVDEAQRIRCPLYLGGGALNLLLMAGGKTANLASLLKLFSQA
ncbi:oxidoreductase-like protein [Zopfia rhizophila CBS 207.26]|uniref:Oxidoreductase-like protein n=1 Tax=Zopfia rhizophila CBS 207.26 TaxID=1314779 RepID=A0A6A6EPW0_9PEZI|nr:oxidoreductase-like protein [Zopfia rhizophila CBS 207.26]